MKTDLKPCPFCGGEDTEIAPGICGDWYVGCLPCNYKIRVADCTEEEAIRYWNTRPAEDAMKKELTEQAANYENTLCEYRNTIKEAVEQNDALKAEVERLKSKLALIKKHLVDNRNALLFVLKTEHDRATYCEFAFCQDLIELINAPEKGGEDE